MSVHTQTIIRYKRKIKPYLFFSIKTPYVAKIFMHFNIVYNYLSSKVQIL